MDVCNILGRHDLHKLIVASLDFAHDNHSKPILTKLLTGADKVRQKVLTSLLTFEWLWPLQESRLYATQHMRVFLRSNAPFFINWGMEMLIEQLYDIDKEVANEAIDILDEACEEEVSSTH